MAMVQITYFYAISKIKVAAAILLQYLAPIFIALYGVFFGGEKLTRLTFIAIAGAITGCYLVVGAYNLDLLALNRLGILGGLGAALSLAFYSVYGERGMRRYNPWTVLFYGLLFSALFWNIALPPLEAFTHPSSFMQWVWVLYIAVFGTMVPFGLYFEGINLIRSTRASITATLEPITAGLVSYLFLNEVFEPLQIFGGVLVIAAVILLQLRQEYDDETPVLIRTREQVTKHSQASMPETE
jgi:drug/metabolite transporter (DMT)-like permease